MPCGTTRVGRREYSGRSRTVSGEARIASLLHGRNGNQLSRFAILAARTNCGGNPGGYLSGS